MAIPEGNKDRRKKGISGSLVRTHLPPLGGGARKHRREDSAWKLQTRSRPKWGEINSARKIGAERDHQPPSKGGDMKAGPHHATEGFT